MNPPATLVIDETALSGLCPTFIRLDHCLRVRSAGPSILRRLGDGIIWSAFWDRFTSERPVDLRNLAGTGQVTEFRILPEGITLRGLVIPEPDGYLLFVRPHVGKISQEFSKLRIDDFAAIDMGLAHTLDLRLRAEMLSEIEELVEEQTARNNENRILISELGQKTHALTRAKDDLVLQNVIGDLFVGKLRT